jgi:hopanoid biosynthesis associated protein HpnK
MIGGPAASDAVRLAKRLPALGVGLHLVLVDGRPLSPAAEIAGLARADGTFEQNPFRAGIRFFFSPPLRRALAREIRAQFRAFRATGLPLDHVNAHKHMHLHPTIARLVIGIGSEFGMRALRVPAEPVAVLARAFPGERYRRSLHAGWARALGRRASRAGLLTNDHLFGLAWSGAMTEERLMRLLPHLPPGTSEIYFHPAAERTAALIKAMPDYLQVEELDALLSERARSRIAELGIRLSRYGDLAAGLGSTAPAPSADRPPAAARGRAGQGGR